MEPQERQGAGQYMLIVSYSLESVYSTSQEQDQEACKVCGCKKAQGYYGRAWILGETVGYIPRDSIFFRDSIISHVFLIVFSRYVA